LFNGSEFSSVDVTVIQLCCHVIDMKLTLVKIVLYTTLLEVSFFLTLGRNVALNTSSDDSKTASEKSSYLFS
jgi:hypothetical protein